MGSCSTDKKRLLGGRDSENCNATSGKHIDLFNGMVIKCILPVDAKKVFWINKILQLIKGIVTEWELSLTQRGF